MPDLDEFRNAKPTGKPCGVSVVLARLEPEDADSLSAALEAPIHGPDGVPHVGIQRWLERRQVKIGRTAIERHRRGECRCG